MGSDLIRVMVVDDHALHREGTRQILQQYPDLEVVGEADCAELALALVNQAQPHVVLMDIRLGGMNGIEATRRIRASHPDVRILVVTAYEDDEYVRGALEAGAAGYLSKAAPGRDLAEAIRTVASGKTALQQNLLQALMSRGSDVAQRLTQREVGVLQLIVSGMHNKQIARHLGISARTVERHCDNIYAKLGVSSRTEAVVRAISAKLVGVPDDR